MPPAAPDLTQRRIRALEEFHAAEREFPPHDDIDYENRDALVREQLARVTSPAYLEELVGTVGADPSTAILAI